MTMFLPGGFRKMFLFSYIIFFHILYLRGQPDTTSLLNLQQQLPSNDVWWQMFGDATLDTLIQKTIKNNYDLLGAINQVEMSKARLRIQQGRFYPTVSVGVSYTPNKSSLGKMQTDERLYIGEALTSMSWEMDVFGNIRKSAKSQKQFYYASQENYRAVMVSLIAQLSSLYIQLRAGQRQLDIANRNLSSQEDILILTEKRYTAGLNSKLDVAQAKSLYLQTKAIVPGLEASINGLVNIINVLTGEYSDTLKRQLLNYQPLPVVSNVVVVGIPAELIRHRPDVRAAEQTMDGLAATVGATRADWWPKFYLFGGFGYASDKFKDFTLKENMEWQIRPSVEWTIFSGRQAVQNTRLAMAQLDEGINAYNNTLLTAIQEVDDAMISYHKSLAQLAASREALEQVKETFKLAVELYSKGLADYQSVLDSQRNMLSFENELVIAESNTLLYMTQLYKALGGGWKQSDE